MLLSKPVTHSNVCCDKYLLCLSSSVGCFLYLNVQHVTARRIPTYLEFLFLSVSRAFFKFSDLNEYDLLQLCKICLLSQSSVGQPATWLGPSVSEPEAETPGTDPDTMWPGEILALPCREAKHMFSFLSCFDCDFFCCCCGYHRLSHILCPFHAVADKALVGAAAPAAGLFLLRHTVSAGAARPHRVQPLQAAHGHGRVRWGQLHCVADPASWNRWVCWGQEKKDICSIHHHPHRLLLKSRSSSVAIIWWKLQWKEPVPVAYVFSEDLCQLI